MNLYNYLLKAGVISGSDQKANTSVSGAGLILTLLRGMEPIKFDAAFNVYGSAIHEQFLENKKVVEVTEKIQTKIDTSIKALNENTLVKKLMKNATVEQKRYGKIHGVSVAYILDIHDEVEKLGGDLKSTSCRTLKQFIESAKKYGYFRQAYVYIKAEKLKLFFFVGITKAENQDEVFILCANDYKKELDNAKEEIRFLFHFFKNYGKIISPKL